MSSSKVSVVLMLERCIIFCMMSIGEISITPPLRFHCEGYEG
jgi:hypothetical protein